MKKFMLSLVVVISLFSLSFSTFAHKYSNLESYKWMVSDCSKVVKKIMMKGYTVQIEQVYTAKTADYRGFYYILRCSKWGVPTQHFHVYASRRNSDGKLIDTKAYESIGYEYGDSDDDTLTKQVMNQMKQKNLNIDYEALIHLRVDCVK